MSRKAIRALTLLMVVAVVAAAGILVWGAAAFDAEGPSREDTTIVLPRGTSVAQIARSLQTQGILEEPNLFRLVVRATGQSKSLRAGEYLVPAGSSMRAVLALLLSGETVVRRLTLPEGLTTFEALALIAASEGLDGAPPSVVGEGGLLPETYHYAYGDARAEVVGRMQRAMAELLDDLGRPARRTCRSTLPPRRWSLRPLSKKRPGSPKNEPISLGSSSIGCVAGCDCSRIRRWSMP